MKVLFITDKDVNLTFSGAQVMTNRNYLSFVNLYGAHNVDVYELKFLDYTNKFSKLVNALNAYNDFINPKLVKDIVDQSCKYDIIVLDFSIWGIIAKQIKENNFSGKIITFFHNLEFSYLWQEGSLFSLKHIVKLYCTYINEKLSCKYSDITIALNKRDAANISTTYKKEVNYIVPISCLNNISDFEHNVNHLVASPIKLLFYGSNFWANANGIKWFVNNVFVSLKDATLIIAGNGMGALKNDFKDYANIIIYDKVEDLTQLINEADFIVNPIFEGSGMKVKTAEALKHAKNIVGTKESFEGYELDYSKVGALCNTKDEFIEFLNSDFSRKITKINRYSREIFINKYSFESTLIQFKDIFTIENIYKN